MSLTQQRHACFISFDAELLPGEGRGNKHPTATNEEHHDQLNNYQRLKHESAPESIRVLLLAIFSISLILIFIHCKPK
jgi:hypothetical protein